MSVMAEKDQVTIDGEDFTNDMSMIMVVGVTGSGKSYFINQLAGAQVVEEGGNLGSRRLYHPSPKSNDLIYLICALEETQKCEMIPVVVGGSKLVLIDTPGFDDTKRSDAEILGEIARVLAAQYSLGFELKGIVYLHRITDIRYTGSNVKTFEIFKRICGEETFHNVLLTTSRWGSVSEEVGADREHELRKSFWAYMLDRGSNMMRFHGDRESAISVVGQLLIKDSVVLSLQKELIDQGKDLNDTVAGSLVDGDLERALRQRREDITQIENLQAQLRDADVQAIQRYEKDAQEMRQKLLEAQLQRSSLQHNPVDKVCDEIRREKAKPKSKWRGIGAVLPFIPVSLSLLGLFVGVPPGSFEQLTDFFMSFDGQT
ncbi:hypothetical protein HIM_10775 [Hirsutella minnesotensis 3608]|uniref:AIG1-type G domain-containing protein n=1 Tax=Hirsutella minnesotensis 3608 TaxID=1043627 RepID=A0A0F7ZWZ3_9HYPO|nr:hypothetical protein HIM_10775 [Hirsutella minnesotensis 3608]